MVRRAVMAVGRREMDSGDFTAEVAENAEKDSEVRFFLVFRHMLFALDPLVTVDPRLSGG